MNQKQGSLWLSRWRLLSPLVAIFALGLVFGLPGCGDTPLDTNTSQQEEVSFFDLNYDEAVEKGRTTYEWTSVCFGTITVEDGGTIEVPGRYGTFRFVVAPNSFAADTVFEVKVSVIADDADVPTIVYEFGPEGLVFSEPARLLLDADFVTGIDDDSVDFFYLNRNKWVYQGTYHANADRLIDIDVHHFSKYGSGKRDGP